LAAVIEGCEAAWGFFGAVFGVLIPDNMAPVVADADLVNPRFTVSWLDYAVAPTPRGCAMPRTSCGRSGWCPMCRRTSSAARTSSTWPRRNAGCKSGVRAGAGRLVIAEHGSRQNRGSPLRPLDQSEHCTTREGHVRYASLRTPA
jgi:hypothetical protein